MKITVNHAGQFRDAFRLAGRAEQFSYEALELLFAYFEECDPDMELDVIDICCSYMESTPDQVIGAYEIDSDSWDGICTASAYGLEKETAAKLHFVTEFLESHTSVVGVTSSGSIVYASNF